MLIKYSNNFSFIYCIKMLHANKIIIYPTESVFGFGCNPDNDSVITKLFKLKNRNINKGVILIASQYNYLLPYINSDKILSFHKKLMCCNWPECITFLVPAKFNVSKLITGNSGLIAVRITKHPLVKKLCEYFSKPIVSTSANISGMPSLTKKKYLFKYFGLNIPLLYGSLGKNLYPSRIFNIMNGEFIRND
ncbi:Threonylcarbamoyl-AMP synthase [Buchnera aphidicola (Pterocallis alni)]|uniref:Sua5/YciO/YrdC/YwlC family protein n=1 Tax=Buchnera aphidicola TaxID=9 RepID=UPI0034649AAF